MPICPRAVRIAAFGSAALLATVLNSGAVLAQHAEETVVRNRITVTQADIDAAAAVKYSRIHVMPTNLPGGREKARRLNEENIRRVAEFEGAPIEPGARTPKTALVQPYFYQGDLVKEGSKAPTLASVVNHAVYIDLPSSKTVAEEWGNPEGFLTDLFKSNFIHLSDQYTGSTTDDYTVGANAKVPYPLYGNVLYEHELWAIVHSVASAKGFGGGMGHLYHLFLPKGVDTCFDESYECYSPDNFDAWYFCAYHDYVQFKDITGPVLFTVEPYQNVDGCAVHQPSPNGKLADSTNSVLAHETFEVITDPKPPEGYTNQVSLLLEYAEIADECQPATDDNGDFLVPTFKLNGKKYAVQLMYSNTYHACAAQP
ncbi:MAG TPA: hypothetical protein VLZ50_08665 [Terracidiphilus sp.]|nr:hypothetical protein [Terracidiphilus sp.]